ncbi:MAG: hypothetical protein LC627_02735, partial [Verrucomicrobiaceae bacterium]|nr:hypothetical protein [Verrucomicrobiaceae bacterium]
MNVGVAAVALRKRWDYLVLLAAAGTALIEFGWAARFFDPSKANVAFAVFLGFEAQFLAIFALRRRENPPQDWTARAAVTVGFAAVIWAFCLLSYPALGHRPGFLFTFAFAAEAGLLLLPILFSKWTPLAPISGAALFFFLAAWTENYLTDALLWWALGGYLVFALLHASFAFRAKPADATPINTAWQSYLPLLPLALIWMCVSTNKTASAVWICVLLLDVVAIAVAFIRRSLPAIVIALLATIAAAGLWISVAPPEIDLLSFLTVAAGSGMFFFAAALFAGPRFFPDSENVRRNIPALAASLPFLPLLVAMAKLPIVNPTPFFITGFVLAVLLLGLGVIRRTSWIALAALGFTWAIEREWQALHFTHS